MAFQSLMLLLADIYALGVFFWELVSRTMFFSEIPWAAEVSDRVIAGERPLIPGWVPQPYATIIEKCWVCTTWKPGGTRRRLTGSQGEAWRGLEEPEEAIGARRAKNRRHEAREARRGEGTRIFSHPSPRPRNLRTDPPYPW
jgi:hypothetical protein